MSPWSIAGITVGFLIFATVVGNPLRRFLLKDSELEGPLRSIAARWLLSVVSGIALFPLVFLNLGLVPGTVAPVTVWILFLGAAGLNLYLYRRLFRRLPAEWRQLPSRLSSGDRWFFGVLVAILLFQMSPLAGLWVTPGDDVKLYSVITQRFIDTQGIPQDWGMFARAAWFDERTHLLLPGFSSIMAGAVYIFGTDVSVTVSILTSVFRSLASASLFLLILAITKRRVPALIGMAVYGLITFEPPIAWFQWGGQAELAAVSILPIAAAATYLVYSRGMPSRRFILWTGIIIGGMTLLHAYAFFYFLGFLLTVTGICLWKRSLTRAALLWIPTAVGLILAAAPVLHAFPSELSISGYYSSTNAGWNPVFGPQMSVNEAFVSLVLRVATVYGGGVTVLLLLGMVLVREIGSREKAFAATMGGWFVMIFLLHENNPRGLFLVPFPLWYRLDANRTFDVTSMIAAAFSGIVLEQLFWKMRRHQPLSEASVWARRVWSPEDGRKRLVAILVIGAILAAQLVVNASALLASRTLSPIGPDDEPAFGWIRTQTAADAVFFVNAADAGTWIPMFAHRQVVFPFGVVTNYTLLAEYQRALDAFIADPASPEAIQFMQSIGATYVYAGPARIYDRPGFNVTGIEASGLFDTVYQGGSVWIFELRPRSRPSLWASDLHHLSQIQITQTANPSFSYAEASTGVRVEGPGPITVKVGVTLGTGHTDLSYVVSSRPTEVAHP